MPDRGKKSLEHLKQKYGLTPEALDAMEYHADMACQICGKFPHEAGTKNRNGEVSPLHVDHDHATSKVRGLLCGKCNMGLGCFRDKPELLLSAFLYLLRHEAGERSYLGPFQDDMDLQEAIAGVGKVYLRAQSQTSADARERRGA